MARPFIIFADSFNENIGGLVAAHRLCHLLNESGATAFMWPHRKPLFDPRSPVASGRLLYRWYRHAMQWPYVTPKGSRAPVATVARLRDAIVVYPEIVNGNPLRSRRVVRWLLHKPGFHTGSFEYGPDDRFFFYQQAFNDPAINPEADNQLRVTWIRDDIYRQTNFGPRQGTCYILRKGKGRPLVHDLADSILVDEMSHTEMAAVFNRVTACISYDSYTMYSQFAALCGCDSIVVPEAGVSKEQWYPDPQDRLGVAYGFDDVETARQSRPKLLPYLKAQERETNRTVMDFVRKCERYFPE